MLQYPVTPRWISRRKACRSAEARRSAGRLKVEALEDRLVLSGDMVLRWNTTALAAIRVAALNPLAAGRTLAIMQAAIYDAVNSIYQSYTPYLALISAPSGASEQAAAAQAAHDALAGLFPAQAASMDLLLKASLQGIKDDDAAIAAGIQVGQTKRKYMAFSETSPIRRSAPPCLVQIRAVSTRLSAMSVRMWVK